MSGHAGETVTLVLSTSVDPPPSVSVGGAACVNVSASGTTLNCTLTDAPPGDSTAVALVDGVGLAAVSRDLLSSAKARAEVSRR